MYAEGETELRDLVVQKLEASGFLNKIKAELRASVLLAFEEEEGNLCKKNPLCNEKLENFLKTDDGQAAVSIVRDFLEFFNLKYTLSVFDPEVSNSSSYAGHDDLCKTLNVSGKKAPVISLVLNKVNDDSHISSVYPDNCISSVSKEVQEYSNKPSTKGLSDTTVKTCNKILQNVDESSSSLFENKSVVNSIVKEVKEKAKLEPLGINLGERISKNSTPVMDNLLKSVDPFFDAPLTSEKSSYKLSSIKNEAYDVNSSTFKSNANSQTSLRNLPALTTKTEEWIFSKELSKDLNKKLQQRKDTEPESNESSDHQLHSEESIEEDLEFSAAEDLSSLSLGEDATSDQTVSQTSIVGGVDHIEPCDKIEN